MRRTLSLMTTVAMLASAIAIGPANAGSAVIEIDQVGGRDVKAGEVKGKLFGKTLAEGIAIPSSAAPDAPAARPLVADAGDSPFVASGSTAVLLGAGYSVTASLIPAMVSDRFSGPHFGAIVGVGLMGSAVGSALGPWLAGRLYDATASYTLAFLIAAASGVVAGAAGWRARTLRRKNS